MQTTKIIRYSTQGYKPQYQLLPVIRCKFGTPDRFIGRIWFMGRILSSKVTDI